MITAAAPLVSSVDDISIGLDLIHDDGPGISLTLHSTIGDTWSGDAAGVLGLDDAGRVAQRMLLLVALARTRAEELAG